MTFGSRWLLSFSLVASLIACSGTSSDGGAEGAAQSAEQNLGAYAATRDGGDGTPARVPCGTKFGDGLKPGGFGRLDGYVASVVSPGGHTCSSDKHHLHVQIVAAGQTYDVAVNVDSGFIAEKDVPLPGGPWSEGWHGHASLDYTTDLGLHSSDFSTGTQSQIDQELEAALAGANHVSVFGNTFSRGGLHLIHRHLSHDDGALVLDPTAPNARVFAFHFANQSF